MKFDTDDLTSMEERGTLMNVITHEMGHIIGFTDAIWQRKGGLIIGRNTPQWAFVGPTAMAEYGKLLDPTTDDPVGGGNPTPVPIEDQHGPGTRGSHWRERQRADDRLHRCGGEPVEPGHRRLVRGHRLRRRPRRLQSLRAPSHRQLAAMGLLASVGSTRYCEDLGVGLPTVPLVVAEEALTG